ncbi:response regulator transcription factor [Paenibacillus dakarensis]|uniref:response regulator transcription factor n=1 Tax=Paenibacillus dakarensis TaxID=1527293 RepID=UPI0006D58AC1|nr:response regulator transcription factor [Paenibacillus dakarensis]
MIKVLIVDDEPKLREGLKSIIAWDELGIEIVDTAANGSEALEKHKLYAPDIMIVDIRMPGMDGLQLIGSIRAVDTKVRLLILSGYADFDYAQRAITHRVNGYLLKPVDEEELTAHLVQIKEVVEQEQSGSPINKDVMEGNREQFIRALITEEGLSEGWLQSAERLGLAWENYQVLLIHIHDFDDAPPGQEPDVQLKRKLIEAFEKKGRGVVFTKKSYIGMLLPFRVYTQNGREELFHELHLAAGEAGVSITSAAGLHVRRIDRISESYRSAREMIRQRFFYHSGELLFPGAERFGCDMNPHGEHSYDPGLYTEQLYYAVDIGNIEVLKTIVQSAACAMIQEEFTEEKIRNSFMELLTGVHSKLTQHHPELQSRIQERTDQITAVYRQPCVYDLCHHSVQVLEELMWQADNGGREQEMKRIIDLIHRNYSEPIKLETLAAVFNYNSAYLGKMFKSTTGEYFNTYLDKVRIDKAKALLKKGMKVYQVAEKVGYSNVDYFHSKFKKYVGISPTNYRKEAEM